MDTVWGYCNYLAFEAGEEPDEDEIAYLESTLEE